MPTENPLVPFRFDASASGADAPAGVEDADAAAVAVADAEDVEAIPVQDDSRIVVIDLFFEIHPRVPSTRLGRFLTMDSFESEYVCLMSYEHTFFCLFIRFNWGDGCRGQ